MLISHWDIYVFVTFDHSIPLFGLILTGSEKRTLFWRFHAEMLISHWDIYVFVSFDRSIPLFGLISTGSKKSPVLKVSCSNVDILMRYLCFCKFLIIAYHYWDSFWLAWKYEPCSEGFMQKHWYPTEIFMFL